MTANQKDRGFTPESTYHYVQGLLKVEDTEEESKIVEDAVGVCFNYLIQKKLQWGIYLEKLMELFLDLAFQTEKHTKIKQVLKNYRQITQNQHPDSLKTIVQYYRDTKLQQILQTQIPKDAIPSIREMSNIDNDEPSSGIIITSFNSDLKSKKQWLRANLKIVWEGYKIIVDTVRLNHKMEGVYRDTLKKVFDFVDQYNRKQQFKIFCDNQRKLGLKNILNKRADRSEQQKNYYIDIQKEEINTNNIEIRFKQFNVASKLGLSEEAFYTLSDIMQIMRVRKGPVKNALKCSYFEKLAILFKKSRYWHYHAFALYNFYSIYITKSNLSSAEKTKIADKLILSVLCIPPSTLQSYQSKESQQKIATMMISTNKIPGKKELEQMMISKGVVQNSSTAVKQLWYFMFLNFDLTSLSKGLNLLGEISKQNQYSQFIQLLEDILIYKQLISVAEVYQKIKYQSLLSIIPFPKQKIERILLESHHRKVIDFVLDEKQGFIKFEDKFEETNPYEQFLSCYVDVALLHEECRKNDKTFIINKGKEFIKTADDFYNNIRVYKIDEYKKKLKKPRLELEEKERQRERKKQQQIRHQELVKKQKEQEEKKENEQKIKQFIEKKIKISEIIKIKEKRIVRIGDKRVENLTDQEIKQMDKQVFEQGLKQITARVATETDNRNKKRFLKIDYIQRERRSEINKKLIEIFDTDEKQAFENQLILSKTNFEQKQKLKSEIENISSEVKDKIDSHYEKNKSLYEENLKNFKANLTDEFKKKILVRARDLLKAAEQKKAEQKERIRQAEISQSYTTNWTFGKNLSTDQTQKSANDPWKRGGASTTASNTSTSATIDSAPKLSQAPKQAKETYQSNKKSTNDPWIKRPTGGIIQSNSFAGLKIDDDQKQTSKKQKWGSKVEQPKQQTKQAKEEKSSWFGTKKTEQPKPVEEKKEQVQPAKFVPPSTSTSGNQESKGAWGKGKSFAANTVPPTNTQAPAKKQQPELTFKGGSKKDDKKPAKGKGW